MSGHWRYVEAQYHHSIESQCSKTSENKRLWVISARTHTRTHTCQPPVDKQIDMGPSVAKLDIIKFSLPATGTIEEGYFKGDHRAHSLF